MQAPSIGKPYLHTKEGVYYPIFIATDKDTEELAVVYKREGLDGRIYVRSLLSWNEKFKIHSDK